MLTSCLWMSSGGGCGCCRWFSVVLCFFFVVRYYFCSVIWFFSCFFFFQAEDGIRDTSVTGVQTCALPISPGERYQVVVHVDAAVLADPDQAGQSVLEDGLRVPAGTSQRLACDASRVVMRHDAAGRLLEEIGRASCRERG